MDEKPVEKEAPRHGLEGWHWEKVGRRKLNAGEHVLRMHCTPRFPRVDAILFTTQDIDPNNLAQEDRPKIRLRPTEVELRRVDDLAEPAAMDAAPLDEAAVLENDHVRIVFLEGADTQGQPQVIRRTEVQYADGTLAVPSTNERLYLLHAVDSGLVHLRQLGVGNRRKSFVGGASFG